MTKPLIALLALALSGCATPHRPPVVDPPQPPPVVRADLVVHAFEGDPTADHKAVGALVSAARDLPDGTSEHVQAVADAAGNAVLSLLPATYHVCVLQPGYKVACADGTVPADHDVNVSLPRDVPPVLAIHVDGTVFRDTSGAIWSWRGVTAFTLLQQVAAGQDIGPYLDHRREAGANLVRVLATMKNIVDFPPMASSDAQLRALLETAHAHGLRVELVALADAQDWPMDAQRRQVQRVIDAVAAAGSLDVVEVANEPFKNSAPPCEVMKGVSRKPGVLMASGAYDIEGGFLCMLDYVTIHNPRDDEWPRKAKDALDIRDGFDGFAGARVPVVSDEPIGADENNKPGSRSNVPDDFFWFAATSKLMGAGATFHSTAGVLAQEPGPLQAAAERAFFAGMSAVPDDAQTGQYTRGPLSNCPLEHTDATALRTFCSLQGGSSRCVVIRPTSTWTATSRDGWRIASSTGPRGSVLTLTR